jgi:hypothetical protein
MLLLVIPVKPIEDSLKTLILTYVNVIVLISMKLLLVLVNLVLINVLLVLCLLITVLLVHLTLIDLILQIVIVTLPILNMKMVMLPVQDVTTDVKNVEIVEKIVKYVMLLVLKILIQLVHVQLCNMKVKMNTVILVTGDVPIVTPIMTDNFVLLVEILDLVLVVSVQLKVIGLMITTKSLNVSLVIPSVVLVTEVLLVTV